MNGVVVYRAPAPGRIEYNAPRCLTGELELFDAGDELLAIHDGTSSYAVVCDAHVFVLSHLARDGATVGIGDPVLVVKRA